MTRLKLVLDWTYTIALIGVCVGLLIFLPDSWYPLKLAFTFPIVLGAAIGTYEVLTERWPDLRVIAWLSGCTIFLIGFVAITVFFVPPDATRSSYTDDYCPGPPVSTC